MVVAEKEVHRDLNSDTLLVEAVAPLVVCEGPLERLQVAVVVVAVDRFLNDEYSCPRIALVLVHVALFAVVKMMQGLHVVVLEAGRCLRYCQIE